MSGAWSVRCEGLVRRYGSRTVLDVAELEIPAGETLALVGPSGSGKSTLLRLLGLLESPDAGRVFVGGREVTPRDRDVRLEMAAAFQRPYLIRGSVGANVEYGLRLRGVPRAQRHARVAHVLARVGLAGRAGESAMRLSGGEAQRVSLARALVLEPRVLLLDEPLASVEPTLRDRLSHEFAEILRQTATTTLYVTHDLAEAAVIAEHVAVMRDGHVAQAGQTADVMGLPHNEWVASFFGMEAPLEGAVASVHDGLASIACGGATVVATAGELAAGERVLVAVRPEDVLLFGDEVHLPPSSARNVMYGTVTHVRSGGMTYRIGIEVGGTRIASTVSALSREELDLRPGSRVTVVFKASAVRVRRLDPRHEAGFEGEGH